MHNRLLRVVFARHQRVLIASDVRGGVHKYSLDLQLLQSSPVVSYDRPVNALCVSDKYIFTRDRFGALGKWDIETLAPLDFYDGRTVCDPRRLINDEEPSPSPSRAIACHGGRLYTLNGYNQLLVLDQETFELLDIRDSPSNTFLDCICVDHPEIHALSSVDGSLYIGNLEQHAFPVHRVIDTNVVHGVVYDARHHRFWTTQDGGLGNDRCVRTGVTTLLPDGSGFREFKLSHEDNEFIAMDPDGYYIFAGGFNGKIAIFDNTDSDFRLVRSIGPLEFQIIHAAVVSPEQIYVLLQTGDLVCVNFDGIEQCRTRYQHRCVWTLEPHPQDASFFFAGTDHGVVHLRISSSRFGSVQIEQLARLGPCFGIVKDVRPLPDGSCVGISRRGDVFLLRHNGSIQWQRQVLGVPRGVALGPRFDRCLISTDEGSAFELAIADGAVLDRIPVGSPSYGCAYTRDGRRVVTADRGPCILAYAPDSHDILGTIEGFKSRLKRLHELSNGEMFVAGPDGFFELDLQQYRIRKSFGDYLVSTKENGVLCGEFLYVGGYGYLYVPYLTAVVGRLSSDGTYVLSTFKNSTPGHRLDEHGRLHRYFTDSDLHAQLRSVGLSIVEEWSVRRPRQGESYRLTMCRR